MVVVVVLVGLTEIPPQVRPPLHDHCIAGLVWWASFWSPTAIAINFVIIAFYLLIASLIAYQLVRTVKVEREERIAASRMVYYLGVGTILMVSFVASSRRSHELTSPKDPRCAVLDPGIQAHRCRENIANRSRSP